MTFDRLLIIEKILVFIISMFIVFVFGMFVSAMFNTEHITIKGITYYCDDNISYYYEDLGSSSVLLPVYNGTTMVWLPVMQHNTIKRTLDYNICNICKTQNIQRDR